MIIKTGEQCSVQTQSQQEFLSLFYLEKALKASEVRGPKCMSHFPVAVQISLFFQEKKIYYVLELLIRSFE